MAKRKTWKILGTSLLLLVILLLLFIVAFVFNPLEGSVKDVRDLVPRSADFYLRKQELADDFTEFPSTEFWDRFAATDSWRNLKNGPLVAGLDPQALANALAQTRDLVEQVKRDTSGFIDPVRDIVGSEIVIAGEVEDRSGARPVRLDPPRYCAYMRVSWRIRAAWGLAQWGFVQEKIAANGVQIAEEGELLQVTPPNGSPMWVGRHLDCLMIGNDRGFVEQSLALADGSADVEPLGVSARYTEGVREHFDDWTERVGDSFGVETAEFVLRPKSIPGFEEFAASWPNPTNPDSMNERVLASFLKLANWTDFAGTVAMKPEVLSLIGRVTLNSNLHTPFQSRFFDVDTEARGRWLTPFLKMVPVNVCAAAAMRMPAGDFLREMYESLDPQGEKKLLDDAIRATQKYQSVPELIDTIGICFLPRTGFVFRKNIPDPQIPVAAVEPVPQIAWVLWLKDGLSGPIEQLIEAMKTHHQALGFQKVYRLPAFAGQEGGEILEFTNPQIPGTGEIATLLFRDFFVLSNSGPLIKDMLQVRYDQGQLGSILQNNDLATFQEEMSPTLNGFMILQGREMGELLADHMAQTDRLSASTPDADWSFQNRDTAVRSVLKNRYPQYRTRAAVPKAEERAFEDAVADALQEMWASDRTSFNRTDRQTMRDWITLTGAFRTALAQVQFERNEITLEGQVTLNLGR